MLVSQILQAKGARVHTIGPEETIAAAVARLDELGIGALVVTSHGRKVVGIVSERDIVHGLAEQGGDLLSKPVSSLMSRDVFACRLTDTGNELLGYMTDRRIRHVPVVEDGDLCGMVSIGDVVKSRLDEIQHESDALREYITQS
tara:strand:- start:400 stop:831 length:432 start_codon:yes stop_codon:yes gene_type:complete